MKRIELNAAAPGPHFIGAWQIETPSLCDALIEFFEKHPQNHTQGKTAGGLNLEAKNSVDLSIRPRDLEQEDHEPIRDYLEALFACHRDYLEQWPFLKTFLTRVDVGPFNIQRYLLGGHFLKVHSERTALASSHRVLAWMTYLNDVDDGGATHFVHQRLDVQPRKGVTLIWPAEWTHAHRADVLDSGKKYIITGWMHFPSSRNQT
ncbi:MAG: 2OG-Fe(II) oxygenase [Gammaproteobacteria bacterium]|nr:2OG-Fe(II) oxygenase [Gammaproteobacteria bacterium]